MNGRRRAGLIAGSLGAVLLTATVLTGCGSGIGTTAEEAKKSVVAFVDSSTTALGDGWEVDSGPGLGKCDRGPGLGGISYVYIKYGPAGPDPAADVDTVEQLWKRQGVTTERYESGGSDPVRGVRGTGGPVGSIDFLASSEGYSIEGDSRCVAGDFDEISRDSQE